MLTDPLVGLDGGGEGAAGVPPPAVLGDDGEPQANVSPKQTTVDKAAANIFIDPTPIMTLLYLI